MEKVLAIIPARGGSKGIPKKNIKRLGNFPLIVYSLLFAKHCPEITECIVSTDSEEIASVALQYGGKVPFLRPPELSQDDTPMFPVLYHGLTTMEQFTGYPYDYLVLLQPTAPFRLPEDISNALKKLQSVPEADGILTVNIPDFNPLWVCVTEQNGFMSELFPLATHVNRRQDLPTVYRINGLLYIWKRQFILSNPYNFRQGKNLIFLVDSIRSVDIDTEEDFEKAEQLIQQRKVVLPWLNNE